MALDEIRATRKNGSEPLMADGAAVGPTLSHFWGWSTSDLVSNVTRGRLAEFIVAMAVGVDVESDVRNDWDRWDVTTPEGIRVEVKSAAHLQSWSQRRLSTISFSVRPTRHWDAEPTVQAEQATRHADVYVLALLDHIDKPTLNPLNLDQWRFFVVPTSWLAARTRSQHSITLASLLGERGAPIGYSGLAAAVRAAADS